MEKPSAKIIAHSQAPNGEELITMEIELHRFVLPEFNTHRSLSRNFQSSRAIPVEKMIEQVRNDPAMPVHWGKNQRGMVADEEIRDIDLGFVKTDWKFAATMAALSAEKLNQQGLHKQIVNRLLEPFMWTKGVVTATREAFEAFFKLRCHKDAQPEIQALAFRMRDAIEESKPSKLNYGEYHLPYVEAYKPLGTGSQRFLVGDGTSSQLSIKDAVKVSTSCCAQVSYRTLDQSLEKAIKIYDMLNLPVNGVYPEEPPHYSPTEHIAKVVEDYRYESFMAGNFHSATFWQYRKALEQGTEDIFIAA